MKNIFDFTILLTVRCTMSKHDNVLRERLISLIELLLASLEKINKEKLPKYSIIEAENHKYVYIQFEVFRSLYG
jgi:hypothetical protein